jgi:HTH-type transcriptional regulator, competence development regulator
VTPTFTQRFGANVRSMRANKRLSQRELAEDAGLSVSFLSEVENGKRNVSLVNAVNIAHALGVPLSYLLPR